MSPATKIDRVTLDRYVRDIERVPLMSRADEQAVARRLRATGDPRAAQQLVAANLRFVVKVAHRLRGYDCAITDLIQEGNLGLIEAVQRFDPERGYRLITYAVWWIREMMRRFAMNSYSVVPLDRGRAGRKLFSGLRSTRARLELEGGDPDVLQREIATRLGVSEAQVIAMELRMAARDFSLDASLTPGAETSFLDMLTSEASTPEEDLSTRERHAALRAAIARLEPELDNRERRVLRDRLLSDDPRTLAALGAHFGVTRERMRQIQARLVGKLRHTLAEFDAPATAA